MDMFVPSCNKQLECEQWRAIGAPKTTGEMDGPVFRTSIGPDGAINSQLVACSFLKKGNEAGIEHTSHTSLTCKNVRSIALAKDRTGGGGRRLLQNRHLLQQNNKEVEVPIETKTVNLAYFFESETLPEGLHWINRPLAPCQPESGPDSLCDIAAFDATGASVRISATTTCTDQFNAYPTYKEFIAGVMRTSSLEAATDEECEAELCSPSAADRGQCRPGKYIIR
eukprot:1137755-Pelagomonas_calceolata.AAC.2